MSSRALEYQATYSEWTSRSLYAHDNAKEMKKKPELTIATVLHLAEVYGEQYRERALHV